MTKYYSLDEIHQYDAQYYMIFGERSNGKSYAVKKHMIDNYFNKNGEQFVISKRFKEDLKTKICQTVFDDLKEYVEENYHSSIRFYNGTWYTYPKDETFTVKTADVMGYAIAINSSDNTKMAQFPKVTTIVLEEFMSQSSVYLPDEINLFLNIVSTIVRKRTNVKIYMLGNAISKHSPYSTALKVQLHRMEKGEILLREYENSKGYKTRFAIQRTENVEIVETHDGEKIVYNIFGDSGVGDMITSGEFETHAYRRVVNNVTFDECLPSLIKDKEDRVNFRLFKRKDMTRFVIKYEDYYYRIYRVFHNNTFIFGFREIDKKSISQKSVKYIINSKDYIDGVIPIKNIATYDGGELINQEIDWLVLAIKQDNLVFINDDNGEDVIKGFRQSGINYKHT